MSGLHPTSAHDEQSPRIVGEATRELGQISDAPEGSLRVEDCRLEEGDNSLSAHAILRLVYSGPGLGRPAHGDDCSNFRRKRLHIASSWTRTERVDAGLDKLRFPQG